MNFIASRGQLRASFMRWTLFTVPLVLLLGFITAQMGDPGSSWFLKLDKPGVYPGPEVFPIVWSVLYVMIGLALALVCSSWGAKRRLWAIALFALHFIGNLAWTPVFFGMQSIEWGLYVIIYVLATLLAVIWAFWRVRLAAALMLVPYLLWVGFASYLTYQIYVLNPVGEQEDVFQVEQRLKI